MREGSGHSRTNETLLFEEESDQKIFVSRPHSNSTDSVVQMHTYSYIYISVYVCMYTCTHIYTQAAYACKFIRLKKVMHICVG